MTSGSASGFTVVELLITLVVAAVLASVAVPAFKQMGERNHMVYELNQFSAALRLARTEALKRGANVSICAARENATGAVQCTPDAAWHEGWVVYPSDFPAERIAVSRGFSGTNTLHSQAGLKTISFNRYGFSIQKDTLVLCPANGNLHNARALLLERSGRTLVAEDIDGNSIVNGVDGTDIQCPTTN